MKKAVLGIALSLSFTGMVSAAEQTDATITNFDCTDFSSVLADTPLNQATIFNTSVAQLIVSCPAIADQIIETAVSLVQPASHQNLMQAAADTGVIAPTDVLLAAIAGGGDPVTLSEPTAGGNLSITPVSAATAPPVIGGRNGGTGPASEN
jgi:hypothetical protein